MRAQALHRTELAFRQLTRDVYCVASGEYQRDSYGIAVPVRLGLPEIPMSLSCWGILPAPDERRIREVIAPALPSTAGRLREALGAVDSRLF